MRIVNKGQNPNVFRWYFDFRSEYSRKRPIDISIGSKYPKLDQDCLEIKIAPESSWLVGILRCVYAYTFTTRAAYSLGETGSRLHAMGESGTWMPKNIDHTSRATGHLISGVSFPRNHISEKFGGRSRGAFPARNGGATSRDGAMM